jgi:hypothetical protein
VRPNEASPLVAYYASTREMLDINSWVYGFTWRGWPRQRVDVSQFPQGTVIVDVIDPASRSLIWRGEGVARVSDDPTTYQKELAKTVTAIVNRFPATARATS